MARPRVGEKDRERIKKWFRDRLGEYRISALKADPTADTSELSKTSWCEWVGGVPLNVANHWFNDGVRPSGRWLPILEKKYPTIYDDLSIDREGMLFGLLELAWQLGDPEDRQEMVRLARRIADRQGAGARDGDKRRRVPA